MLLMLFFSSIEITAQQQRSSNPSTNCPGVPGACGYQSPNNQNNIPAAAPNPSPQNGNGTLGQIYNFTKCGLNFTQFTQKLGKRFGSTCPPASPNQPAPFTISGIPACAVIEKAFLWAEGSGNGAAQTATIAGPYGTASFPMTLVGSGPDKCWGYSGSHTYRADVTSIVGGNGVYNISGLLTNPPTPGNDMDGATLFVIYSDPTATYQGTMVIHDGCVVVNGGTTTRQVTGFTACQAVASPNAKAFCMVGDIQCNVGGQTCNMNGVPSPFTPNWWNYQQVNTSLTNGQNTVNYTVSSGGDCYNLCVIGLYYQTTTCTSCPTTAAMTLTTTQTNATCTNCNGTATVTGVTGGNPPYTYSWAPSGGNAATATGLCPGTYTVTVTANNGCLTTTSVVTIASTGGGLTLNNSVTNVLCNGQNTGSISSTVTGGTGPFNFTWTPAVTNNTVGNVNTATNLAAGSYVVTVTDVNNCSATQTVTVTQPPPLTVSTSSTPSTCGLPNGSVTATPAGGVGPYTYSWTPGPSSSQTYSNLAGGPYSVVVTDNNGCTATAVATVNSLASPTVTIVSSTNVACFGGNDGSAACQSSGGTLPISYSWSNGDTDSLAQNIPAGTYTVTATDANGCIDTAVVNITEPPQLTATTTQVDVLCFGNNTGSATVTPSGGTPQYTYVWSSGGNGATENGLAAGTYTCDIIDANNCMITVTVTITEPTQLTATETHTDALCFGSATGSATVTPSGGTAGYTYSWSSGGSAATENNLLAGNYTCLVTDNNGCTVTVSVTITEPTAIVIQTSSVDAHCNLPDGSASAIAVGGTGNLTYNWLPNNVSGQNLNQVVPGTYSVVVTDANGCVDTATATVGNLPGVVATVASTTNVSCFGLSDGAGSVNASNGTLPYTYAWSPNVSATNAATGLAAGNYVVTVTDSAGCISTVTVTITQPPLLTITATLTPSVVCLGTPVTLNAVAAGGTPNYNFIWTPGNLSGANQTIIPQQNGSYTVDVTDANGCTANAVVSVSVDAVPAAALTADVTAGCAPHCVNFTDVSTISTGSITGWFWDFGDMNTSTSQNPSHCFSIPGTYNITLIATTAAGCSDTIVMSNYITAYPNPVAAFDAQPQPTTELNPTIYFTDQSSLAASWLWSFGDTTNASSTAQNPNFSYVGPGCHTVVLEVETVNGCVDTAQQIICIDPDVTIYVPNAFTPNGDGVNDFFFPQGVGIDNSKFEMWIFDRWGNMIYYTKDMNKPWDGTVQGKSGTICQIDTYVWKIKAVDLNGKKHNLIGHVSLIR
ncbi:MAG: hypothetical protein Fur0041_13890 [Bacteroidia bacterium]